ncbi:MAG: hydrolase [SAR202 cluster bacterium Io17-Chloro-G2]|nr:MAG: hydrolase [SAR202 cluster bacterium Io17-Chloro-G2]
MTTGIMETVRDPKTDHLLTAENSALVLIDYQPSLIAGTKSISREALVNNVVALAKAGKMFGLPVVLSTIGVEAGYQQPTIQELQAVLPDVQAIDRHKVNAWEEPAFREAVEATGRRKLIMAALWTEVCLVFPALDLLRDGYEVYAVSDASGGTSADAHQRGMERIVQAGAAPVTWEAVMAELARLYQGDYVGQFVEIMQNHLPKSS